MIQQKKTYRFSDDTIITEENIRKIGELIALSSVRARMIHSTRDLYYVFQNLYKDIYCHTAIFMPIYRQEIRRSLYRKIRKADSDSARLLPTSRQNALEEIQ